jgi:phospholipase DDHD2
MALGSPLGLFFSIRNSAHSMMFDQIKETVKSNSSNDSVSTSTIEDVVMSQCFALPTCSTFYNVFHPHDPVAYRIEPLLDPSLFSKPPVVIIHHKGGFRAHYLIKNIATQITDTVNIVFNPAGWFSSKITPTVNTTTAVSSSSHASSTSTSPPPLEVDRNASTTNPKRSSEECPAEIPQVALNAGRRIDYTLQETGLENANEYVSSITSHTVYFDMKDVARFIVVNIWARD